VVCTSGGEVSQIIYDKPLLSKAHIPHQLFPFYQFLDFLHNPGIGYSGTSVELSESGHILSIINPGADTQFYISSDKKRPAFKTGPISLADIRV
jgi:hypothetical protein